MFERFIGVNFWTALVVLINTLLVCRVGRRRLFEPVKRMMDSRRREIGELYAQAETARGQALALQQEYAQKLSAAEADAEKIVKDAVERGRSREEEILRRADAEAAARVARAGEDAAREKRKALNEAKKEIAGLALAIAEKVVCRTLNREALVDGFVDGLGDSL